MKFSTMDDALTEEFFKLGKEINDLERLEPVFDKFDQLKIQRMVGETGSLGEMRAVLEGCLLYTSPSPRDRQKSRMPSSA